MPRGRLDAVGMGHSIHDTVFRVDVIAKDCLSNGKINLALMGDALSNIVGFTKDVV